MSPASQEPGRSGLAGKPSLYSYSIVICALVPFGANLLRPNSHEPGESLARGGDMVELLKSGLTTINLVLINRLFKY